MTIPFLHKTAAGLIIDDDRVLWVQLTLLRDKVISIIWKEESFASASLEKALARLAECVPSERVPVATSLKPLLQRTVIIHGPALAHEEDFDAWLQAELKSALPSVTNSSHFTSSCQVLSLSEDAIHCLLLIAREDVVETPVLTEKGFQVTLLGTPIASMHLLLAMGGYSGNEAVLILGMGKLLVFNEGHLSKVESLHESEQHDLISEIENHMVLGKKEKLLVAGKGAEDFVASTKSKVSFPISLLKVSTPKGVLPTDFVLVAALALSALTPGSVNIIASSSIQQARIASVRKQAALHTILCTGLAAMLLLLVSIGTLFVSTQLRITAEDQRALLSTDLARIEIARAELEEIEHNLSRAQRVSLKRSDVSSLLTGIAALVPQNTWITSLSFDKNELHLQGLALNREDVTVLLGAIEQGFFSKEVRLISAKEEASNKLFRSEELPRPLQKSRLTTFKISLQPQYKSETTLGTSHGE